MAGTQSVSDRLRRALEKRGKNLSWLHEQVEDSGVRGSSYGSVYAYVKGEAKAEPPLEFLREAADALGVRLSYLAAGSGPMTGGIDPDALETKVLRGLGVGADSAHHPWADALDEARRRLEPDGVEFPLDEARDVTDEIIEALHGPLKALDIEPERMGWDAFNDYLLTMVPALLALAPEYERQRPYAGEQEGS